MSHLGRKLFTPRAADALSTFQRMLRFHIANTSVLTPKPPPSTRTMGMTTLIFAAAIALMLVLAYS